MGQGTYADYNIIWAKNIDDGGKVKGFIVEKDSKGLSNTKIQGKMSTRMTQNADIYLKDVFVSDANRLTYATDFQKGTNALLKTSRI